MKITIKTLDAKEFNFEIKNIDDLMSQIEIQTGNTFEHIFVFGRRTRYKKS